jgi:hypothetical protein
VRLARKVVSVLVLAALGVAADSTKTSVARPAPPHAEPERRRLIEHERRLAAIAVEFVASSADRSAARICALWVG